MSEKTTSDLDALVNEITNIGLEHHAKDLLNNAGYNAQRATKSLKDLPDVSEEKRASGIVVSAGPSLKRQNSLEIIKSANYGGQIVCTDGSYVALLKKGLIPDYVLCLDPHPTRIVRWFGDPDIDKHIEKDDYFERQDLNVDFRNDSRRENTENIKLVNKYASLTKAIVATTVHQTITNRLSEAGFDIYWWHPLVDNPSDKGGITARLYNLIRLPCMNTGGTVGTACLIFAELFLKIQQIAIVGMDYGYYSDLPIERTQTYYELLNRIGKDRIREYFVEGEFSLTGEKFYTDPTYYWYRRNFYELVEQMDKQFFNCTDGGMINHPLITNMFLMDFLKISCEQRQKTYGQNTTHKPCYPRRG